MFGNIVENRDGVTSVNGMTGAVVISTGGTGDVVGPSSATDNAIARYDTTTGKLLQNSIPTIDDSGNLNINAGATLNIYDSTGTKNLQVFQDASQARFKAINTGFVIESANFSNIFLDPSGGLGNGTVVITTNLDMSSKAIGAVTQINDSSGNELFIFSPTASAVNEITIKNNATTASPSISATGGDTNVNLLIQAKGTGAIQTGASLMPTTTATYNIGSTALRYGTVFSGSLNINNASAITLGAGSNVVLDTATGTKIGTATTQKIGFYNATPVVQGTAIADSAGNITSVMTQLNLVLAQLRTFGLIAP